MKETPDSTRKRLPYILRVIGKILLYLFAILIVLFFALSLLVGSGHVDLVVTFLFGWISFLSRTLPNISWNWELIGMGLFCTAVVLLLAHRFLAWVTRSIASARNSSWRWPWKWTWCGFASIVLLFLVGMSIGGVAHQIGWVLSSTERWFEPKGGYGINELNNLKQLELAFRMASNDEDGDVTKIRRELWDPKGEIFGSSKQAKSWMQSYQILVITDEQHRGKAVGTIIFPRDGERRKRGRGCYSFGGIEERFSLEKLPELIKKHEGRLVAL